MRLDISIEHLQHIRHIDFSVDLSGKSLICIAGENGSGKTVLFKAIKNLISSDTIQKTSSPGSVSPQTMIRYRVDGKEILFNYDAKKKVLDSKDPVPTSLRKGISIELPIPYGERFVFFKRIAEIDAQLRSQIVQKRYKKPEELVDFLESVYKKKSFERLAEIKIGKLSYYAIVFDHDYYLREDHFSSGEYFLVSLYRQIVSGRAAIFIDEIDISLDAAAQVRLVSWLKIFKEKYHTTFVFTTHSLAMMKTLDSDELFYMEHKQDGGLTIENRSYGFIKSTLFGFKGWDRYILTEDEVLKDFLEHLIAKYCRKSFFQYKIIYVGGGTNTTDLMDRNKTEKFFSADPDNVITILDGDQRTTAHAVKSNVYCIPVDSIEKELLTKCLQGQFWNETELRAVIDDCDRLRDFLEKTHSRKRSWIKIFFYWITLRFFKNTSIRRRLSIAKGEPAKSKDFKNAGKRLFKYLIAQKKYSKEQIFDFIISKNSSQMISLSGQVDEFINLKIQKENIGEAAVR